MNNNHILTRNRNIRNELLRDTDYYMLPDVYDVLNDIQKKEIRDYRQTLRDFINENKEKYLTEGSIIDFPKPPEWCNLIMPKY